VPRDQIGPTCPALHRAHTLMQDTWPTHATIRKLGEEIRPLNGIN
jgi:hypothetical protein